MDAFKRAKEALARARALRESVKAKGIDGIRDHVEDVDGDWLERWNEEDYHHNVFIDLNEKQSQEFQGIINSSIEDNAKLKEYQNP